MKPKRVICICDGKRHWFHDNGVRVLRTYHKLDPYCQAHEGTARDTKPPSREANAPDGGDTRQDPRSFK